VNRLAALYYWSDIPPSEQAMWMTKSRSIDYDVRLSLTFLTPWGRKIDTGKVTSWRCIELKRLGGKS